MKCERPSSDRRSVRLTTSEVDRLRSEVSALQSTLLRIGVLASKDDDISLRKIRELLASEKPLDQTIKPKKLQVTIGSSSGSNFSIFGPTSAFYNVVDMTTSSGSAELTEHTWINLSLLMQCISNFFKWQYPDIATFIHRESFLNDFFNFLTSNQYCSEELVYAIASIGSKCSTDDKIRNLAPSFFETSKSKIFSKKICQPQVSTLQALLCLALYELGDGNASASWMLSGMAIRMGYDLGFQLNPSDWSIANPDSTKTHQVMLSGMDVLVRSRIYWGCYVFDHFISLVMGRPVTVRKSEASIPSSENLPNSQNIEDYIFEPRKLPGFTKNVDPSTTIEPLCSLSECIGSLLSDVFSNESSEENSLYLAPAKLDEYNSFLSKWRQTLPRELRWRKSEMQVHDYNPTVMNVRLYYYIVLICLNRPFIIAKSDDSGIASAVELCNTAISELSICLGKFNEAQFPSSILVVYSSILAISVLLLKLHSLTKETDIADDDLARLRVFYTCISRACSSWKLASKSLMFIKNKVADMQNLALRQVFDSAEDASQDQLTDGEVEQLLEFGEDFPAGIQDNFFHGFFEFFNYEDGRPY